MAVLAPSPLIPQPGSVSCLVPQPWPTAVLINGQQVIGLVTATCPVFVNQDIIIDGVDEDEVSDITVVYNMPEIRPSIRVHAKPATIRRYT